MNQLDFFNEPEWPHDFCYLTGVSSDTVRKVAEDELYGRLGVLVQPDTFYLRNHIPSFARWGMDNGCFSSGDKFNGDDFIRKIDTITETVDTAHEKCLFATAPDVFDPDTMTGDPIATIERSLPLLPRIRDCGVPAALVYQDGMERMEFDDIPWDDFDVAFIGGGNDFKLGYPTKVVNGVPHYRTLGNGAANICTRLWAQLIHETHKRGKLIHVGRSTRPGG